MHSRFRVRGFADYAPVDRFSIRVGRVACVLTLLVFSTCDKKGSPTESREPVFPAVTSVLVTPGTGRVEIGDSLQLSATAMDSMGGTIQQHEKVVWQSSAPAVAQVDSLGKVRGVGAGEALITARVGARQGEANIVVSADLAVALTIAAPPPMLIAGDTVHLAATAITTSGRVLTAAQVEWQSLDPALATVAATGQVKTVKAGVAQVVARAGTVSDTAVLVITSPDAQQVRVTESEFGGGGLIVSSPLSGHSNVIRGSATVSLSSETSQIVLLLDNADNLRGLAITIPRQSGAAAPMIDASSTAAALIYLSPGIVTNAPDLAATRLARIARLGCYPSFSAYLRSALPMQDLNAVMRSSAAAEHLERCLREYDEGPAGSAANAVTPSFWVRRTFPGRASISDEMENSGFRRVDIWEEHVRADGTSVVFRRESSVKGIDPGFFSGVPGVPSSDVPTRLKLSSSIPPGNVVGSRIWVIGPGDVVGPQLPLGIQQEMASSFVRLHALTYFDYVVMELVGMLPIHANWEQLQDAALSRYEIGRLLGEIRKAVQEGNRSAVIAHSIKLVQETLSVIAEEGDLDFKELLKLAALFDNGVHLARFIVDHMWAAPDRAYFDVPPSFGRVQRAYGDGQSGQAGALLPTALGVRVVGETANPLSGVRVRFTADDGGSLIPSGGSVVTNSNGEAFVQWRLSNRGGDHRASATITSDVNTAVTGSPLVFVASTGSGGVSVCTAASDVDFVSESHPDGTQVGGGQSFTKTWTLRNPSGSNCVWDSRITLRYVSNTAGLLSTSQSQVAVSGTIQPNGTYTFSVPMKAPGAAGTYREDWRLVDAAGNTIRVGNSNTVWAQIVVPQSGPVLCTSASTAVFVGESHPDGTQVGGGQSFTKTWTLRNPSGSNCVWDSRITLRYVSNTAGLLSTSQNQVAVSGTIEPNGTYTFSVPMKAPGAAGTYREDWRLVDAAGNTIRVGNSNTVWAQIVVPPSGPVLCTSASTAVFVTESHPDGTQVGAGQSFTKTWTLRNPSGSNCVWDSRITLRYVSNTAGLLSTSQNQVAVSGTIEPNGTYTFSVPIKAPGAAGTYREDWRLVDAAGNTIRVGNSNTVWAQIVVPPSGPALCTSATSAVFVTESHPDGTQVGAGQTFTKTWTLRNPSGSNCVWDSRITLRYVSNTAGLLSTSQSQVAVSGTIQPNGTYTFSVPMKAPGAAGTYREDWRLLDAAGNTIRVGNSNTVWAQIVVPPTGPALCTSASSAVFGTESHPDGTQVGAGQGFTKTWTLRNPSGSNCVWDSRITLRYVSNTAGLLSTSQSQVAVSGTIQPNGTYTFSVPMKAPGVAGTYREDWRLVDAAGNTIRVGNSNTVWALIVVK